MNENAEKTITAIQQDAQQHAAPDLRMVRTIDVGQHVRQGDVYIERIAPDAAHGASITDRQLAPGTTKGSRHCVDGDVRLFAPSGEVDPLTGPIIDASERFTVTHPEHAHISLPSGRYAVTYQRDYAAEERTRVRD